jgi:hypothetical protein
MFSNMMSIINNTFQPLLVQNIQPARLTKPVINENPFATPFITVQNKRQSFYGKNTPVQGGYFAGYHNGKQNIVGRKIFIDV